MPIDGASTIILSKGVRILLQAIVSLVLLAGVVVLVDARELIQRLQTLRPFWLAAALLVTVPQYAMSAARWQLTARQLGVHLTMGRAIADYYLAGLGNQLLPGGVMGDVARALRHGRRLKAQQDDAYARAVRAVVYERAAGQAILFLIMLCGLTAWPAAFGGMAPATALVVLVILILATLVLIVITPGPFSATRAGRATRRFASETRYALFSRDVIAFQVFYSLAILATYLACFYCAGRAIDVSLSMLQVLVLVPSVLFSMTLPITIAGWGVREATAAGIWRVAGFAPADGVAVSVAYGLIVLISTLPGALTLLFDLRKGDVGDKR